MTANTTTGLPDARALSRKIIAQSWVDRGFPDSADRIASEEVWVADAMLTFAEQLSATPPAPDAAVPAGMTAWHGGDTAPHDWDGGPVLFRNGKLSVHSSDWRWKWKNPPYCYDIVAYTAAAPKVASDTGAITPEWCLRMADLEAGQEIGAGSLDHPLRTKCELPPAGWVCTREPGHDGPCAAVASGIGAKLRGQVARIVNPNAFASRQSLYDYCINQGDSEDEARKIADDAHKLDCDKAFTKADAIIAALATNAMDGAELREALNQIRGLIQEAKALIDGKDCGFATDHLDFAESWIDKAETLATTTDATDGATDGATGGGEVV